VSNGFDDFDLVGLVTLKTEAQARTSPVYKRTNVCLSMNAVVLVFELPGHTQTAIPFSFVKL
jgi:hypothetical protein